MEKYDIPTAKYQSVTSKKMGEEILRKFAFPLVIKADGLCAGKGVKICKTENEAISYLDDLFDKRIFGDEAKKVVIEEFLSGEEASLMCFVSKGRIIPMESAPACAVRHNHGAGRCVNRSESLSRAFE